MWRVALIVCLTAFFSGDSLASASTDAIGRYLDNPTEENAIGAVAAVSASHEAAGLSSPDLQLVRDQIVAGSAASLRLVLAMIPSTDGGDLEDLMALAAASIRPQPLLFLEEVARAKLRASTLEAILLMPGLEYSDRPQARTFELAMRQRSIAGVNRRELRKLRDQCRRILGSASAR